LTQKSIRESPHLIIDIDGIDYGVVVDHYIPSEPGGQLCPPVAAEFEWHLIDEYGERADYVTDGMSEVELDNIEMHIFKNSREAF